MPFSLLAPQYWEKNKSAPPANPKYQEKNSDEICEQMPTAATDSSPMLPIMIVSTMLAVVDNKF